MKKSLFFVLTLALSAGLVSCNKRKQMEPEKDPSAELLLKATTEGIYDNNQVSKAYIASGNWGKEIMWSDKDQVSVFSESSSTCVYTLKEGKGTSNGVFHIEKKPDFKNDNSYAAYFPASVVSADDSRSLMWPSEQTRVLYHPEIVNMPLLAEGSIQKNIPSDATFNSLGGVLDILLKVPDDGVAGYLRKVVISADQKMSGKFTLQTVTENVRDASGKPTTATVQKKYAAIDATAGSNTIIYTLEGNSGKGMYISKGDKTDHHLMLALPVSPEKGYTNFKVDFYDQHGTLISGTKTDNVVIERGMITNVNIPFSHVYAPGLTMNDPVGTIGTLYGVDAIVIEIGGIKRALALHNVGYTDTNPFGTEFSFDSNWNPSPSLDLKNGWRLPYVEEWKAIANTYGGWQILQGDYPQIFPLKIADKSVELPFVAWSSYFVCSDHGYGYVIGPDNNYYCISYNYNIDSINGRAYARAIRELPFYPELDPERQLTKDDPIGSIGMIGTRQAVVMELRGYKVAVATLDVGSSVPEEHGSEFEFHNYDDKGWDFSPLYLSDGWRLPTSQEIVDLMSRPKFETEYNDRSVNKWILSEEATLSLPFHAYTTGESCYYLDLEGSERYLNQIGNHNNLCARPFHNLEEITKDSPEGTVGVVDGRECVVVADDEGKKFLITVNNPGPAEGEFGDKDHKNSPWLFECYVHGYYSTPQKAKDLMDAGFFGKGWKIPTVSELKGITVYNDKYTKNWYDGEKRLEIRISDSYTWYMYAGGWIDPGQSSARNTDTGYYLCTNDGHFSYLKFNSDVTFIEAYKINSGSDMDCRYSICLTHEMPN